MNPIETLPGDKAPPLWTQKRVQRLVDLWNDRLSAAAIARTLGPQFTRSAVVGKLFRMGLRRTDEQRHDAQAAGARWIRARLRPPPLPVAPLPPPTPCAVAPRLVGILDLRRSSCRWPYDVGGETRFCGHTADQTPYCAAHRAVAYGATLPPLTLEALADRSRRAR